MCIAKTLLHWIMALKVYKKCKSPQGFKEDSTFFILSMTFLKWRDKLKMFKYDFVYAVLLDDRSNRIKKIRWTYNSIKMLWIGTTVQGKCMLSFAVTNCLVILLYLEQPLLSLANLRSFIISWWLIFRVGTQNKLIMIFIVILLCLLVLSDLFWQNSLMLLIY